MKKLFLVAATLLSANVFALSSDFKFVPLNDSQPTNLCVIAAQDGIVAAKRSARQAGIFSDIAFNMTECNGQSIRRFASQFKQTNEELETQSEKSSQVNYEFKVIDQAEPSLVCKIAAEQGLRQALRVGGEVAVGYVCNGVTIQRFARLYKKA